nr:uncharacterized protein LOC123760035 isoform X4 [Procambarus clarkii]
MNNRGNPNHPIFPSLTAPWSGFTPGTHSVLSPPPRFPYSVDGSRGHQSYVPGGVVRGPTTIGRYARSPSPSLYSHSSFDYSTSERDRRLSPPVPRHRPQDDVINSDPVVFNAGFTFRMGKETHVHNHVEARAAYTVPEAQSSNLTRQIDKFLKKTDHMLDRYSAVVESRSANSLAKRRGKSATPGRGLDDSPDPSMSLSYRAQRSTSAAAIAVKAEKHFEALTRIGSSTSKKAAPIAEHEEDDDLESSSSDSFDELDTDDDIPPTTDVFSISDDTSADLSKLDDLSSDSDDEYFDVVAVPGLRPHLLAAQSPPAQSPTPHHQLQQPVQHPHIPPTHSRSLPAVNKGNVVHRMGTTPVQPVDTVVVNKPSETIAAASNPLSALPKALTPTSPVDANLINSSVQQAVLTAQTAGSSEKGSAVYRPSKVDDSTMKGDSPNSPKNYQAPQLPSITEQLENTKQASLSDKQGSSHFNKMHSVTADMQRQIVSNKQGKTLIGKQDASLLDRKPPDKLESSKDLAVNLTSNESTQQEKKESGSETRQTTASSPHRPQNRHILSTTNKTASKPMQQPIADKTLFLSAVANKIRAGSPVPEKTAVIGMKLSPAVLTGKLEIASSDGSTIVRKNSTLNNKAAIDAKVNSSSEILEPEDSITLNNKLAVESNLVRKSVIVGDEINGSTLKENENKLTNKLITTSKTNKANAKSDNTDAELHRECVSVSKEKENAVNPIQIGNTSNKENPRETEAYIERSSRCSSVASNASRAVSPDGSLRSGAKRSRSGKLASVLNMWESDEISQKSEKGKSKPTSTAKIGKITGLASVFEGEKSAGTSSTSKNIITKLKSPYSPPFSPERKPAEEKITNIAGISTAKFGNVSKFKKPGEPKMKSDAKNEASNADKKKVINMNTVKDSDIGQENGIMKKKGDEKADLNNATVINSAGKGCEDKITNGDVSLTDSSISLEDEGKDKIIKKKKVKISTSSSDLASKSVTDTNTDAKLLESSATQANSVIVKNTELKAVKIEAAESNIKFKATESKNIYTDGSESKDTRAKISESMDTKAKISKSKDTKAEVSEFKDTKAEVRESKDIKAKINESKDIKAKINESKDTKSKANESKDTTAKTSESKDTKSKTNESKDIKAKTNESKDTKSKTNESKDIKAKTSESMDTKAEVSESKDTKSKTNESKDIKAKTSESMDTKAEVSESKDTKADISKSKDIKAKTSEFKDIRAENMESSVKKVDNKSQQIKVKMDAATNLDTKVTASDPQITSAEVADARETSVSLATTNMVTGIKSAEISNTPSANGIEATQINVSRNFASGTQVIKAESTRYQPESTSSTADTKMYTDNVCNTETKVDAKTTNAECIDLKTITVLSNDDHLKCNVSLSNSSVLNAHIATDTGATGKESEALKTPESVPKMEGPKKDVFGSIKSFIESVAKGGKTLEDKLSINGLQFSKKSLNMESIKDMNLNHESLNHKTGISSENSEQFERQSSPAMSLSKTIELNAATQDNSQKTIDGKQSLKEAIHKTAKALPQLESEVDALIREASVLIAQNEVITKSITSGISETSITQDEKRSKIKKSCSTSVGEEGEEEVYVDAIDPSQLDTLMPLPDVEIERDWRSRSRTPLEGPERSPSTRSVVAKTEALLSETDRILRRSRSDKSLRRSYSRSISAAALNKSAQLVLEAKCELQAYGVICSLAEVTADLSEEHGTAHLAGERLEAEQAERMKLEKEVERLQTDMRLMTTANGKLEMEKQALRSEVLSVADFNGDADHDYDEAAEASLYKRKYEWCLREIELLKKQLKQQQEDDLDHLLLMKKQLEKKVSDAYEETEEQRQVVAQMKRKSQRLQAELNDLKMLLEEQASRNNLLEKKQRKFDQDMMGAQEELRHERANKEKIQRERDQILSEKYSFEQEVSTLKLELELKDEKISSLSRELEDLSFTGKVEEEVATLKKAKHDLELRVKDQEEELDDLAGQVQMLEGAKVRLEMSIEQMRKENRREISQREEELEEVRISAQKKIKALEAQLENEHEERTLLVREKHEQERRINELQDRTITHVDEDYIHKLKKELKKTKALLRDTQTMLEKSQSEGGHKLLVRQLKTQLEDAEFAKTAAIKARQCAEADIQELATQLEEAQRAKKEAEDRCARVAKDRAEIQTQLEESEEEVAEVMKKYKSCVSQLSVDQITLSEQSQQIAELEHEKQVLQERMLELSSKVEVLEGETANIHTQRRLEMKIKEIESKLELEQTTRQRLESQIGRLKDQIERMSGDCDAARQKEAQALEQSKKIGRQLREAKEDLSALQQRHTDAVNKKGELEKQLELADSEVITLKSDLKLAFKRIEDLQQAIQGDINDSDSDISDSDSDSDGSLSSYLTASLRHQRSSSNSTLRTPPSEVQQLDRMEQPNSPCSEAMSAISEDLDDVSHKESYA